MRNRARESRKSQQGFSLLMVLIVLATGSLAIPATLNYVVTGAKTAKILEVQLHRQYAGDAGVQYMLWMLEHNVDDVVGSLDPSNPSISTTITVNGEEVTTTLEISISGEGGAPGPMPTTESGIHVEALLEVDPGWAPVGEFTDFDYIIHARNYGTSSVSIKGVLQILPPDFEYIEGSYGGPDAVFTKTWVTDHWELDWDFEEPLPSVVAEGSFPVPFTLRGFLSTGAYAYLGTGYIFYSAFGEEETLTTQGLLNNISVGLYDITTTVGGETTKANAGIYAYGVGVNSYEIE